MDFTIIIPNRDMARAPSTRNFGAFTGSVTGPVITNKVVTATPRARTLAWTFSLMLGFMA